MKRLPEANLCALPLIASSGVQMVLGLTDTSSVQWLSLVTILLVGGGSLAAWLRWHSCAWGRPTPRPFPAESPA